MKVLTLLLATSVAIAACKDNAGPLGAVPAQINNAPDNFQFQATGVTNVTWTYTYTWSNTGTSASVNQSTTIAAGTATVTILDASGVQVYTQSLSANGTFPTSTGTTGNWTIRVVFTDYDGTVNFRVQKA